MFFKIKSRKISSFQEIRRLFGSVSATTATTTKEHSLLIPRKKYDDLSYFYFEIGEFHESYLMNFNRFFSPSEIMEKGSKVKIASLSVVVYFIQSFVLE